MSMSDTELKAFYSRVKLAAQRGYGIARAEHYAALLMKEAGLSGYGSSTRDLSALCDAAVAKRAGKPQKAAKPAPKPAAPKPAAKPVPEPVEVEAPAEESYETMSRDELYEEAKARGIEGRSEMNKAELAAALEKDDAGYEGWTQKELYAEAQNRGIEGRSEMNKAELIAALEKDG